MPEIIEEVAELEKPVAKPVGAALVSLIAGLIIGGTGGYISEGQIDEAAIEAKLAKAKTEIISEFVIPEKTTESYVDTVIGGKDTTLTVERVEPARTVPAMTSYNTGISTGLDDTVIVQMTRGDSIIYHGVFTPPPQRTPILKVQFLDLE
jgi:hypothetical protein